MQIVSLCGLKLACKTQRVVATLILFPSGTCRVSSPVPLYPISLLIATLSGAAALSHEMLWTRRLVDLLGGSSESSTRVLSLFFVGLAIGGLLADRYLTRSPRPWWWLAAAELSIALLSLAAWWLPTVTAPLWPALGTAWVGSRGALLIKLGVAIGVVVPPAIAMGVTLPLLVRGSLTGRSGLAREGIWLYATNTAGGLLGLLTAAAWLLPQFGLMQAMLLTSGLNALLAVLCGAVALAIPTTLPHQPLLTRRFAPPSAGQNEPAPSIFASWRLPVLIATLSGLGLLAAEIIALQMMMLVAPLSYHAPVGVLAAVILALAIAAPISAALGRRAASPFGWLQQCLLLSGMLAIAAPWWYYHLATPLIPTTASSLWTFNLKLIAASLFAFGPMLVAMGLVFPATLVLVDRQLGDRHGKHLGRLLAANGLGGLIGAEIAYRLLMPLGGVHVALGCVGLVYLLAASTCLRQATSTSQRRVAATGWLVAAGLVNLVLLPRLPHSNPHLGFEILQESAGVDGVISVIEHPKMGRGILVANQYLLGSTSAEADQRRQAHLPLVLHPQPRRVGFIGVATGATPAGAIDHGVVEELEAAEISATVARAAADFFGPSNSYLATNSRARLLIEDGRMFVAASPDRFDVLVGDLFLPWGAGAGRLYSREHFLAARAALRPGGLFCQWLPLYQLTDPQLEVIVRTFSQVFSSTHLFRGSFSARTPKLALIGWHDAGLDWRNVGQRTGQFSREQLDADRSVATLEGVQMLYLGPVGTDPDPAGPINTLGNTWIEREASRHQLTGDRQGGYLSGTTWLAWLSSFRQQQASELSTNAAVASPETWLIHSRLGDRLSQWEQRLLQQPNTDRVRELGWELADDLPPAVLPASQAQRDAWPGVPAIFDLRLQPSRYE